MTAPALPDVADFRGDLALLTDQALGDLVAEWSSWPWDDARAVTDSALLLVPEVTVAYSDMAAGMAADRYDLWRDEAFVSGRFVASPAEVAAFDQIEAGVRNAVGSVWSSSPNPDAAQDLLAGLTVRHVMHGANDTIVGATVRDEKAVGWSRVAKAGACRFCRMLAGRTRSDGRPGGVYRTEKSARFAAHDHCSCAAVPSWDQDAAEVPAVAYVASRRKQTPADRARVRAYLDANFPD